MIEPYTLLEVEPRTGFAAFGDVKLPYKLVKGEHLLLRSRVPA